LLQKNSLLIERHNSRAMKENALDFARRIDELRGVLAGLTKNISLHNLGGLSDCAKVPLMKRVPHLRIDKNPSV
jgi:hypothetical protein